MPTALTTDNAIDAALNYIDDNCDKFVICSQLPTTYTEANSTYALGSKSSPTISDPTDGDTSGRKITISAITDGSVDSSGTASHFALLDTTGTEMLWAGPLGASQAVTSGNTWTLPAFDIEWADPA